ncbi:TPA: lytic transglycosylase domain-containing protein [Citrobacter sedlakii]|nr:lytic transglycosylase domain-containing protein [Citrobacter sedlakii]HCA7137687.1 lytic transglycosylase domain-containing protein [Citrobacter sedlakii]HCA7183821.1 lytic transglycosylase domain-containing protein [Citrobacter sedlakii]
MLNFRYSLIILFFLSFFSFASKQPAIANFRQCFNQASERFHIDHRLLIAIAEVESSMNPNAIGLNKRGGKVISEDVGLMQINSSWFPTLASMGITRNDLLNNPCQNIYVGAWILAKNISSNGVNWESVGAYNAGFKGANAPFRMKYAKKVYARYIALTGEG